MKPYRSGSLRCLRAANIARARSCEMMQIVKGACDEEKVLIGKIPFSSEPWFNESELVEEEEDEVSEDEEEKEEEKGGYYYSKQQRDLRARLSMKKREKRWISRSADGSKEMVSRSDGTNSNYFVMRETEEGRLEVVGVDDWVAFREEVGRRRRKKAKKRKASSRLEALLEGEQKKRTERRAGDADDDDDEIVDGRGDDGIDYDEDMEFDDDDDQEIKQDMADVEDDFDDDDDALLLPDEDDEAKTDKKRKAVPEKDDDKKRPREGEEIPDTDLKAEDEEEESLILTEKMIRGEFVARGGKAKAREIILHFKQHLKAHKNNKAFLKRIIANITEKGEVDPVDGHKFLVLKL